MDCREFDQRMQSAIDDRRDLASLQDLNEHANECWECDHSLKTWLDVQRLYPSQGADDSNTTCFLAKQETIASLPSDSLLDRRTNYRLATTLVGTAAIFALIIFLFPRNPETQSAAQLISHPGQLVEQTTQPNQAELSFNDQSSLEAGQIWQMVQDQDWVGHTMPAVESVRNGVAPIGRSLLQAVAILTNSGGQRTS